MEIQLLLLVGFVLLAMVFGIFGRLLIFMIFLASYVLGEAIKNWRDSLKIT